MTAFDRDMPGPLPFWSDSRVTPGRGDVGTGLFQRVLFVDVFDGPEGQARVRALHLPSGPTPVSEVISTGHEVALEEDRAATLLLPLAGRIFCATGSRDLVAVPGQAMVLPRGRRRTVTLRDGAPMFRARVLRLPDLPAVSPLANGAVLDVRSQPDLAAAAGLLAGLGPAASVPSAVLGERIRGAETLVQSALAALTTPATDRFRISAADRALRRAEDLIRAQFAEEIAIRDIARAAGLSMRQLQHLFATAHGLSPHAWLTRLRLEQARLMLKGALAAPAVTEVALSSGFPHLGRFPATYRARFGTLPSADRSALR